jgi:hypothetical protein
MPFVVVNSAQLRKLLETAEAGGLKLLVNTRNCASTGLRILPDNSLG